MKRSAIVLIVAVLALFGCAEESEPTMDKNLVGGWAYEDSNVLYLVQFYDDKTYKQYLFVLDYDNTYCDAFETGKATTSGGKVKLVGEGGRVTNTFCLNWLFGSDPYEPVKVPYSVSGGSLTMGDPGEKLIMVSATIDPAFWSDPMYGDWVAYLGETGSMGLALPAAR